MWDSSTLQGLHHWDDCQSELLFPAKSCSQ
jgi:hypothetical protein